MSAELKNVPLFSTLSDADIEAIASLATTRNVPANTLVVHEGDQTDSLYIIRSGRVRIFLQDDKGKEVILTTQGPGDYFGEMVLDGGPRSASVMSTEPCQFTIISKVNLERFIQSSPAGALAIIRQLIARVRSLTDNVRNLALLDVYGRLRKTLLDLAVEENGVRVIKEKLTQQDLANRVGASREMVSKIMKELSVGGYIRTERKIITVLRDPPTGW
jgi:CRP/FNR family cyclic AMP-dependent transcriptional regulator